MSILNLHKERKNPKTLAYPLDRWTTDLAVHARGEEDRRLDFIQKGGETKQKRKETGRKSRCRLFSCAGILVRAGVQSSGHVAAMESSWWWFPWAGEVLEGDITEKLMYLGGRARRVRFCLDRIARRADIVLASRILGSQKHAGITMAGYYLSIRRSRGFSPPG